MKISRTGSAVWSGGIKDGHGRISTRSGVLDDHRYGFSTRFGDEKGTNPEELIAAAHAGCFTMALSKILGDNGLTADRMETTAEVTLEKVGEGFDITAIHLELEGSVPGADADKFEEFARLAKDNCPVSKLFKAPISLSVTLS